jgi:hypothetical protein
MGLGFTHIDIAQVDIGVPLISRLVIWCYFCSSVLKIMRQGWRGERKNKAVGF